VPRAAAWRRSQFAEEGRAEAVAGRPQGQHQPERPCRRRTHGADRGHQTEEVSLTDIPCRSGSKCFMPLAHTGVHNGAGAHLLRLARRSIPRVTVPSSTLGHDEEIMTKRRRRFKQTTTLAYRLTEQAGRLRDRARTLPPGTEQTTPWRKVRQTETALRIDAWLSAPQSTAPSGVVMSMDKREHKRPAKSAHSAAP
jgi:hypothetical protein